MIPYDSILQQVNGKIYSLHHMWSSFYIYQPEYAAIRFYAVSPADGPVIVAHIDGRELVYKELPESLTRPLDKEEELEKNLATLISGDFPHEPCHSYITEVSLGDVLDRFCHMQDFIATSSGLWAPARPGLFEYHPNYKLLFQLKYRDEA